MATAEFGVTKVLGQWRISKLKPGLLLTTNDVSRAYRPGRHLLPETRPRTVVVPDQILIPVGPGASTLVGCAALLAGPTPVG